MVVRAAALLAVLAVLSFYYGVSEDLPTLAQWGNVAFIGLGLMPLTLVLVAVLIIPVDSFSVARGPTKEIVKNQPQVFDALSIAFPLPGLHSSAQLGLPDILFFSLFLAAAVRFGLRVGWTWLAMALSFGTTLALAVAFDVSGLPALPLLSAAFILVNADILWRRYRERSAMPSK